MRRLFVILALLILGIAPAPAGAAELVAAFEDDGNDASGPGSYRKPGDSDIVDGDFDLRRFEVWRDGDDVLFKVTMGAPFREPDVTARTMRTPLPLWNHIFLQNIDIYIDSDPASAAGFTACIPGRRVAFPVGRTWKTAVVLTPQPGPAAAVTEDALGEAARHILFPQKLLATGRTITARVPQKALGGPPRPGWAYSVHVSGARWERSFEVVERVAHGKPEPDAFTMPIRSVGEAWAFGGAPEGTSYPRVIDVLLPRGVDQKAVLGAFGNPPGAYARVPFVSLQAAPTARAPAAPPGPAVPALTIADVSDETVTLAGPTAGLRSMMIGRVVGPGGAVVGHVVVVRVVEGGIIATASDGGDQMKPGFAVQFDAPTP